MQLQHNNLNELFSVVDTGQQNNGFDFVNRQSQILVVTVGDSWTWGQDIAANASDSFRQDNIYGALIAAKLNADWLNLAQAGSGNFWIADKVCEFCRIVPLLNYTKIYLICTYTEVGRALHTLDIDFVEFFRSNPVEQLLEFCDTTVTQRILTAVCDPRIVVKIGRNFVDHCDTGPYVLPVPWYQLFSAPHSQCRIVSPWAIEDIHSIVDSVPQSQYNEFLSMLVSLSELALQREKLLRSLSGLRNYHPTPQWHRAWADYILQQL